MQLIKYIIDQGIGRFLLILLGCCLMQPAHAQCIIDKLAQDLNDAKASQAFKDFIKGNDEGMMAYKKYLDNPYLRKDVDVLNATANFLTRHADYLEQFPGKFDNILNNLKRAGARCNTCPAGGNKGIPSMHVVIDDLDWAWTTFREGNVDIQKLFTEMAASHQKADGGAYMINVLRTNAKQGGSDYVSSITKFEYKYLDDGNFEADLFRTINGESHLSEFKSFAQATWEGYSYNEGYVKQFLAYFRSEKKFEYIANVTKLGTVDDPAKLVRSQFMKIFEAKAPELFAANPSFFRNIKYGDEIIDIESIEELRNLCKNADFANSSLFDFVKVK